MRDIRDMEAFAKSQNVLEEVYSERRRQVDREGWAPQHDDEHDEGEMAFAAAAYATYQDDPASNYVPGLWPWAAEWWKPTTRRRNLIKAAALIIAEIERLDRLQGGGE